MTRYAEGRTPDHRPAIVVVDDDREAHGTVVAGLRRRYGADYDVREASDGRAAFAELLRLRDAATQVALVVASHGLAVQTGTELLTQSRSLHPTARRVVMTALGDHGGIQAVARALALGEIDHHAPRPQSAGDEPFMAAIGDVLADWAGEHGQIDPALTIIGERWNADSQALRETLERWGFPSLFVEAGTHQGQELIADLQSHIQLPAVILRDGRVLARPSVAKVVESFGWNSDPLDSVYDLIVIGSGPAGLSAAVNAASEGLRTMLVEPSTGQASSSPMLRNYVGFPAGVSGAELVRRAFRQALWFGVQTRVGRAATGIQAEGDEHLVELDDGSEVRGSSILLATGLSYRRVGIESVERLVGRGVFYGPGATEATAMAGECVAVVGGANSAAEAAVYLARYANKVSVLVRGASIERTMSEYLVGQLGRLENVEVRLHTEIAEAEDSDQLRSLAVRNTATGEVSRLDVTALFILIGAAPRTDWLPAAIARDDHGFVLTGTDAPEALDGGHARLPLETSVAGIFAAGDVRHGSVKRIAAAVGEGAAATHQIHQYRSTKGWQ